jgi:DNA-binding winged helix-turn-helix (wHTH) protein
MTGEHRHSALAEHGGGTIAATERARGTPQRKRRRRQTRRRAHGRQFMRLHEVYEKGRLRIDFDAYEVFADGKRVHLFLREFELLCFFVQSPNRVFDRTQILQLVWGRDSGIDPRTIDVHVRRLRTRIERDDAHPELIVTVRGVGYKFDDRALERASGRNRDGSLVATTASTVNPAPSSAATTSSIRRIPR